MEEKTQRQGGFDREVRVLPLRAPGARSVRFPGGDGRRGQPDGDIASTDQGSIVGGPVPDVGTSSCTWDGLSISSIQFELPARNLTPDSCTNAHTGPHHSRRGHPHALFSHWTRVLGLLRGPAPQEPGTPLAWLLACLRAARCCLGPRGAGDALVSTALPRVPRGLRLHGKDRHPPT